MLALCYRLAILYCLYTAVTCINDISEITFSNELNDTDANDVRLCTTEYPRGLNQTELTSRSVSLQWQSINVSNLTGYQIIYWKVSTTTYKTVTVGLVTGATISDLIGFTQYYVTVRGVCNNSDSANETYYSAAADRIYLFTPSRSPDVPPANVNLIQSTPLTTQEAHITWEPLNDNQWNGLDTDREYIVELTDIGTNRVITDTTHPSVTSYTFTNLEDKHIYIVVIYASNAAGVSPPSNLVSFRVELPVTSTPTTVATEDPLRSWQFYAAAIPSGILLALLITIAIICCKMCCKKKVGFVRDINRNLEDGKMVSSQFNNHKNRFEMARISQQNRPLPPNPAQTPTLSVTSMNAHLIGREFSPPGPIGGATNVMFHHQHSQQHEQFFIPEYPPGYPITHQHSIHYPPPSQYPPPSHHHHPLDTMEHNHNGRLRSVSITSPHYPTLSQPLSDISTSSVFTESNIPHPEEMVHTNGMPPSSPNPPNPYEIPNESETGHHSASPPHNVRLFSGTRRPQTAQGMIPHHQQQQQQQMLQQHPTPYAQSNMELQFTGPPPVIPHRSNSNVTATGAGLSASLLRAAKRSKTPPQEADYSEIPDSPTDTAPRSGVANSSPVSSDQYNSYSDIPSAISPHLKKQDSNHDKERFTSQAEVVARISPGHSSLSDSISSFSTDSQSASPNRRGNASIPRTSSKSSSKVVESLESDKPTPYLLPSSVKPSNNPDSTNGQHQL